MVTKGQSKEGSRVLLIRMQLKKIIKKPRLTAIFNLHLVSFSLFKSTFESQKHVFHGRFHVMFDQVCDKNPVASMQINNLCQKQTLFYSPQVTHEKHGGTMSSPPSK